MALLRLEIRHFHLLGDWGFPVVVSQRPTQGHISPCLVLLVLSQLTLHLSRSCRAQPPLSPLAAHIAPRLQYVSGSVCHVCIFLCVHMTVYPVCVRP